jgi:phosphatidylserine/phosphatidylglycerophosphate/cardiolipin synthase-like enzyme
MALEPTEQIRTAFQPIRDAIARHRASIASIPELVAVRPGFRYEAGGPVPAVVLAFMPPLIKAAGTIEQTYGALLGVPVRALEASPEEQVLYVRNAIKAPLRVSEFEQLFEPPLLDFRPPVRGTYEPPKGANAPRLDEVNEEMRLTIATSPDAGWPVLKEFLAQPVQHRMQIGIYQFTAPHVYKQLRSTLLADDDARLLITLHPTPEKIRDDGTKAEDVFGPDLLDRLRRALGSRFAYQWMSVGNGKVFASSYHIKVAVADGERMWLSSGNLQSSNQPPYDPLNKPDALPDDYLRSYNREHHVILEHAALARTFEGFLQHDFRNNAAKEVPDFAIGPDLFVAEEVMPAEEFAPPRYFEPLRLERKVRVQPLLTPDNYAVHALKLIESAQSRIYLQNQYININAQGQLDEFTKLLDVLKTKIDGGLDVRIICRDLMKPEKLDLLVAMGFDAKKFRFLKNTHTKIILVDGKQAMMGSHNWSNEGVASNRDASLLFYDEEIARHCEKIFLYDWGRARPRTAPRQPRVAREGETPFAGAVRLSWESVFDEAPPMGGPRVSAPAAPATRGGGYVSFSVPATSTPATAVGPIAFSGINGHTGEYLFPPRPVKDLATALRKVRPSIGTDVERAANRTRYQPFGLMLGLDPDNLRQVGWAAVVPEGDQKLTKQMEPLLRHRAKQIPEHLFRVLEYRAGEQARDWLQRHNVAFGNIIPSRVPFHLLLLGGPDEIPFEFQYLLDLEYSVGRVAFDSLEQYAQYAASVVRYETEATPATTRDAVFFAPQHAGDPATELSHTHLVQPLVNGNVTFPPLAQHFGFRITPRLKNAAKCDALLDVLHGRQSRPSVVFTAGHGMGFPDGDAQQTAAQGALLMQDWTGVGSIKASHYVKESDIANDAKLHGLVAFFFACYGAGTPQFDTFPLALDEKPAKIAAKPFLAGLPKKLLGHPNGGALAVFGHIERAWGYSIRPISADSQLMPFWNAFARIMTGATLGTVTKDFNERSALLSSELLELYAPGANADDTEVVSRWIERNDARAYILLGDPGARLRVAQLK